MRLLTTRTFKRLQSAECFVKVSRPDSRNFTFLCSPPSSSSLARLFPHRFPQVSFPYCNMTSLPSSQNSPSSFPKAPSSSDPQPPTPLSSKPFHHGPLLLIHSKTRLSTFFKCSKRTKRFRSCKVPLSAPIQSPPRPLLEIKRAARVTNRTWSVKTKGLTSVSGRLKSARQPSCALCPPSASNSSFPCVRYVLGASTQVWHNMCKNHWLGGSSQRLCHTCKRAFIWEKCRKPFWRSS